jgi:predicted RNA binding protein YcfA (HicA-like mRNA interferase family)
VIHAAQVRELITDLRRAGFFLDHQSGSQRQLKHERFRGVLTVSGQEGGDAKPYQERQVKVAIQKAQGA